MKSVNLCLSTEIVYLESMLARLLSKIVESEDIKYFIDEAHNGAFFWSS